MDPAISRIKFDREIATFRSIAAERRAQGWWLFEASYPEVLFAFVAPQLRPAPVLFGVLLDFTNYDLWAPSVRFVDPFTKRPYLAREIPPSLILQRKIILPVPGMEGINQEGFQPLLLSHSPDMEPFLCLPGVREYHDHPAHTGDSWLLHRDSGEGTLHFLLETIAKYGVEPLRGYQFGLNIVGYVRGDAPQ